MIFLGIERRGLVWIVALISQPYSRIAVGEVFGVDDGAVGRGDLEPRFAADARRHGHTSGGRSSAATGIVLVFGAVLGKVDVGMVLVGSAACKKYIAVIDRFADCFVRILDRVVNTIKVEDILAATTGQFIYRAVIGGGILLVGAQDIVAIAAEQLVGPFAADEEVGLLVASNLIVAAAAVDVFRLEDGQHLCYIGRVLDVILRCGKVDLERRGVARRIDQVAFAYTGLVPAHVDLSNPAMAIGASELRSVASDHIKADNIVGVAQRDVLDRDERIAAEAEDRVAVDHIDRFRPVVVGASRCSVGPGWRLARWHADQKCEPLLKQQVEGLSFVFDRIFAVVFKRPRPCIGARAFGRRIAPPVAAVEQIVSAVCEEHILAAAAEQLVVCPRQRQGGIPVS